MARDFVCRRDEVGTEMLGTAEAQEEFAMHRAESLERIPEQQTNACESCGGNGFVSFQVPKSGGAVSFRLKTCSCTR